MIAWVKQLVAAKPFHHFIVAVIVLAGVVAGLAILATELFWARRAFRNT